MTRLTLMWNTSSCEEDGVNKVRKNGKYISRKKVKNTRDSYSLQAIMEPRTRINDCISGLSISALISKNKAKKNDNKR